MNHRRLVSLISNLFVPHPAPAPVLSALHLDAAGRAFVGDSYAQQLTVVVHAYASDTAALIAARFLLDDAGVIDGAGSLYAFDRQEHALPAAFAPVGGGLVSWRTVHGRATSETSWVSGVFYRNSLVWEISVNGNGTTDLGNIVIDMAKRLIDRGSGQRQGSDLDALLPVEADLPASMHLDAGFDHIPDIEWHSPMAA
jgi:hypothetical protein